MMRSLNILRNYCASIVIDYGRSKSRLHNSAHVLKYYRNLAPISGTMLRYRSTIGSEGLKQLMANGRSDDDFEQNCCRQICAF